MQADLIDQGLTLMLVGMGTVFVFLTSLVIAMTLMSIVLRDRKTTAAEQVSEAEVAAITAAITAHRKR
ncbi:MAG: OadG family protein [Woeseiaceae bacterium]